MQENHDLVSESSISSLTEKHAGTSPALGVSSINTADSPHNGTYIHKSALFFLIIVALVVGFFAGQGTSSDQNANISPAVTLINTSSNQPRAVDFENFWTVWQMIHNQYVDRGKLSDQELVYGAIEGMVRAVDDPYTVFFKPKDSQNFSQQISGSFGGIGIEIGLRKNVLTVISPIKDTPAERAGLQAGDKILQIDDRDTDAMTLDEAVDKIRGRSGTVVRLTILHDGATETKQYSIQRVNVKIPAVSWKMVDDDTAVISLYIFNKNANEEFRKAAREISNSSAKRIILDLRNNPGGLLDSAVNIASYFTEAKIPVVIERFGDGREDRYVSENNGLLKNYPVVILINKGSASASEILAGALRDIKHAKIVGETSFGKGSVQILNDLNDKSAVKITIAKWFTPNGTSINESGVIPDVIIIRTIQDIEANKDPQLDKARELVKQL